MKYILLIFITLLCVQAKSQTQEQDCPTPLKSFWLNNTYLLKPKLFKALQGRYTVQTYVDSTHGIKTWYLRETKMTDGSTHLDNSKISFYATEFADYCTAKAAWFKFVAEHSK